MEIDWNNQPIGFPLWLEGIGEHSCWSGWYKQQGEIYKCMDGGQFRSVREGQFFIVHKKPSDECEHSYGNAQGCPECGEEFAPDWNGEGFPPVGCEIEAMLPALNEWFWQIAKVVHGPLPESPTEILVFSLENTKPCWVDKFRPIRSAEQIAADERAAAIEEMWTTYWQPDTPTAKAGLGLLWDAGWRKQASE